MTTCPHCSENGVAPAAKRRCTRERPARCTNCGLLSHVLASTSSGIPVATLFIASAFFLGALLAGVPQWLGVVGIPVAICYNVWAWRRAELFPISGESATVSRQAAWVVNLLAIFSIFWS